jgi:hypothetical protein
MISRSVPLFFAALLWSTALTVSPANARCTDRPGTPTNVVAIAVDSKHIEVSWTNTATEQVWWDVEMNDGGAFEGDRHGNVLPLPAGVGRGDQGVGLRVSNLYDAPPLSRRCFRVKARTGRQTEGCVSEKWSNPACADTPAMTAGERPLGSVPYREAPKPIKGLGKARQVATTIDDVDIYDGPDGTRFKVIGMLRAGVSAVVTGRQEGWYQLKIDAMPGGTGWVAADHLTVVVKR